MMGRFPVTLYKEQWLQAIGYVGGYSRVHCREQSAVEGKGPTANRRVIEHQALRQVFLGR
jgi:hypothetical protein